MENNSEQLKEKALKQKYIANNLIFENKKEFKELKNLIFKKNPKIKESKEVEDLVFENISQIVWNTFTEEEKKKIIFEYPNSNVIFIPIEEKKKIVRVKMITMNFVKIFI